MRSSFTESFASWQTRSPFLHTFLFVLKEVWIFIIFIKCVCNGHLRKMKKSTCEDGSLLFVFLFEFGQKSFTSLTFSLKYNLYHYYHLTMIIKFSCKKNLLELTMKKCMIRVKAYNIKIDSFPLYKNIFLSYNSLLLHYKSVFYLREKRNVFKKTKTVTEKLRNTGFRLRVIIKEFVVMYKVRPWFQKAQLVLNYSSIPEYDAIGHQLWT